MHNFVYHITASPRSELHSSENSETEIEEVAAKSLKVRIFNGLYRNYMRCEILEILKNSSTFRSLISLYVRQFIWTQKSAKIDTFLGSNPIFLRIFG